MGAANCFCCDHTGELPPPDIHFAQTHDQPFRRISATISASNASPHKRFRIDPSSQNPTVNLSGSISIASEGTLRNEATMSDSRILSYRIKSYHEHPWGVIANVEESLPWMIYEIVLGGQWDELGIQKGWVFSKYNGDIISTKNKDIISKQLLLGEACCIEFCLPDPDNLKQEIDVKEDIINLDAEKLLPLKKVFSWTRFFQAFFLVIFSSIPAMIGMVFYFVYDDQSWNFIYLFVSLGIVLLNLVFTCKQIFQFDLSLLISASLVIILNSLFFVHQVVNGEILRNVKQVCISTE